MNNFDYIPYHDANIVEGVRKPSTMHYDSQAFNYWFRALTHRVLSIVKFNLPESWERAHDFFEYCLFFKGYVAVFDTDEFGLSFQPCAISGYDFYYQPTKAIIANPLYSANLEIGTECELIRLTPDYRGIGDIITYYSEKLASLDGAENMAIQNSKLAYILAAKNKTAAQALKMIFDKMNAGESTVIFDKKIIENLGDDTPFEFIDRSSVKNSYLTTDILQDFQTILNQFDNEIGIPTLGAAEKKERMITDEATAKNADTSARVSLWDESLSKSIEVVNSKFNTDISYEFVYLTKMNESEKGDINVRNSYNEWT